MKLNMQKSLILLLHNALLTELIVKKRQTNENYARMDTSMTRISAL